VLVVVEPSFESIALAEKIKDLAAGINKKLWAVLNKISSDNLIAEIKAKLKRREMETIGVISYDASVFFAGLKGDALSRGRATRQAAEILDSLLPAIKTWNVEMLE
jgi:CO dehydrogenase maturation factor